MRAFAGPMSGSPPARRGDDQGCRPAVWVAKSGYERPKASFRRHRSTPSADRLSQTIPCAVNSLSYREIFATRKPFVAFAGFLVELRGFEPLTSAVRLQRSPI